MRQLKATKSKGKGSMASIALKLSWDTKAMPAEGQKAIWEGVGALLAAAIPPEERPEFLAELQAALELLARGSSKGKAKND